MNLPVPDLIQQIKVAHAEAQALADKAVGRAVKCGEMLLQLKERCKYGEWLPALAQTGIPQRTAWRYMNAAQPQKQISHVAKLALTSVIVDPTTDQEIWVDTKKINREEIEKPLKEAAAKREKEIAKDLDELEELRAYKEEREAADLKERQKEIREKLQQDHEEEQAPAPAKEFTKLDALAYFGLMPLTPETVLLVTRSKLSALHPDKGGNAEEFKKARKLQEKLL